MSMVGYMSLGERVDKDFSLACRKALLGRIGAVCGGRLPSGPARLDHRFLHREFFRGLR